MRLAAVHWIASLLRDAAIGVNAQLASAPTLPGWPLPESVEIFDETTALWVASGTVPQSVLRTRPYALVVMRAGDAEADVLPAGNGYDAYQVVVHFLAKLAPGQQQRNDLAVVAEQAMRAARRVISTAMPEFVQQTYPTVAGCEFGVPQENAFSYKPMQAPLEGGVLLDALVVRLAVHDAYALGLDIPPE